MLCNQLIIQYFLFNFIYLSKYFDLSFPNNYGMYMVLVKKISK